MKTRTVTERIGEYLGPVDWSYDFRSHFNGYGCSDSERNVACEEAVEWLRQLEAAIAEGKEIHASTYGGWPRIWQRVLSVGMYDGWPYWRPVPSVCLSGTLGAEWHSFHSLTGVNAKFNGANV